MAFIDLHTHSYFSDGSLSPRELVKKAKEVGLAAIALTDHDNLDGLQEAIESGKEFAVEVIAGVEITSYPDPDQEFHFTCYFFDYQSKNLQNTFRDYQKQREERSKRIVKNLNDLGYLIEFGDLRAAARGTIVAPHIAWVAISDPENKKKLKEDFGEIPSTGDFIVKFLVPGAPAYEPRVSVSPSEAIKLIHDHGGLVFLAHPCWNLTKKEKGKIIFDDSYFDQLIQDGLDGIEVFAHRDSEVDTKVCVAHYEKLAKGKGLLVSGGSDYHGFGSAGKGLGFADFYLKVPYNILEEMKKWKNK